MDQEPGETSGPEERDHSPSVSSRSFGARTVATTLVPLIAAAVVFVAVYTVRNSDEELFGHRVTLMTRFDGVVGGFENRNQMIDALWAYVRTGFDSSGVEDIQIISKFNTFAEIEILASSQARAAEAAEELADHAVAERASAAREASDRRIEIVSEQLDSLEKQLEDAQASYDRAAPNADELETARMQQDLLSIGDSRNEMRQALVSALADRDSVLDPAEITYSSPLGREQPNPERDAAVAAAVAAILALAILSMTRWRLA